MTVPDSFSKQFNKQIGLRLVANKPVRRNLPQWGRIHIDRQLPFLCVYRRPMNRQDEGTEQLITGQAAYITASANKVLAKDLSQLVIETAQTMSREFGSFLIIEIWSSVEDVLYDSNQSDIFVQPNFDIVVPKESAITDTVKILEKALSTIKIQQRRAKVNLVHASKLSPPRLPALLPDALAKELGCVTIGIVVRPIYRQADTGEILPLIHQAMIRDVNRALQQAAFAFSNNQTKYHPPHYQMLGRRAMVKAVWQIDTQLANIDESFDFLLQVTPVNSHTAWTKFKRQKFNKPPLFHYRPHSVDPALLKRELWNIHIERIEDPTLQHLFREKRRELDIQISMLSSMNRQNFLYGSMQLYGALDAALIESAKELLDTISPYSRDDKSSKTLNAHDFAQAAHEQINQYRALSPDFNAEVHIQSNVTGLMVSHGNLLIGDTVNISVGRAEALLSHEVGVHIVTYFNGQAQPFKLLSSGLAGYEELQEGLAVLSEYLVGGLSKPRLRLLAARVIVADSLIAGATFIDSFRLLTDTYRFKQRTAFNIVMRIYRAGGLTKDAVYLRGLIQLLHYLKKKPLNDLFFVGKIAIEHIPIIEELQRRKVIQTPKLLPHFLNFPQAASRLENLGHLSSISQLIERKKL